MMKIISTRQAAKRLGLHFDTLSKYISSGKLPAPTVLEVGTRTVHAWTEKEIEETRKLLPKIANGRKTRWQRQREAEKAKHIRRKKKAWSRPKK